MRSFSAPGSYPLSGWRKIATALWDAPSDPQIYGAFEMDATGVLAFVDAARARGHHVTATHLVGKAVARALVAVPDLNVRLVGDRAYPRPSVDVFFITAVAKGRDLSGVKVTDMPEKTACEVAKELSLRATRMKAGNDPDLARAKRTMEVLPRRALRVALRFGAWVTGDLGRSMSSLGLAASPFGSAMVSSVGMLGIPMGFSPLAWMYRVPLLVLVGEITPKPTVVDGRVEVRPSLPIAATIDHRYVDGAQIGEAFRAFRAYLADPASFEDELTPAAGAEAPPRAPGSGVRPAEAEEPR